MRLLAIDPGPQESAWVDYDAEIGRPLAWGKETNEALRIRLDESTADGLAVEMIASYGMSVGADVFSTCVIIGRLVERWSFFHGSQRPFYIFRRDVKLHLCGSQRAKDSNIRQALIDRYGPGKEKAIGLKKTPGPLYGMSGDVWQALAVAVTASETRLDGRQAA